MYNFEHTIQSLNWNLKPINLYRPIEYTLESGGKRLRPMLVNIASKMFGGYDQETIDKAGLAIEVFHNFTLLHDDLMDNSPSRRNKQTVHIKWNANTAILSGDAMLIKAYEFLQQIPQRYWSNAIPLFTQTAIEVCEGQQYDMDFEKDDNVSIDQYFEMIRLKTAVLLACSLKMGAIVADATVENQKTIYDIGIALGIAFQLKDDYLDTFGSFETLGKRIGDDILCYKKTFLLISALKEADDKTRQKIQYIVRAKDISDKDKISFVTNIFRELKIDELCEKEIDKYYTKATQLLDDLSVEEHKKEVLQALIKKLKVRDK
ncbi:MAG: isoprenyl synthetase [Bacteroidales bacterium]|nr:MAG: isoprenyl synthetase [Bacteroidales bacterium]